MINSDKYFYFEKAYQLGSFKKYDHQCIKFELRTGFLILFVLSPFFSIFIFEPKIKEPKWWKRTDKLEKGIVENIIEEEADNPNVTNVLIERSIVENEKQATEILSWLLKDVKVQLFFFFK